jgi:hypothetical protein
MAFCHGVFRVILVVFYAEWVRKVVITCFVSVVLVLGFGGSICFIAVLCSLVLLGRMLWRKAVKVEALHQCLEWSVDWC